MQRLFPTSAVAVAVVALTLAQPAAAKPHHGGTVSLYSVDNLVSDGSVPAPHTDPNLVNAWGIAFNPIAAVWVADNGTSVSTLYDGEGNPQTLVVSIPGPLNSEEPGAPTGIVFTGPARFLFATEQGTIAAWAPNVDVTHAFTMVDNSAREAIYKGLALSAGGNGNLLYATDFHNRQVDVFDDQFQPVQVTGGFVDPIIPANFAPFGIQAINGDIYVTFAEQDADGEDDVHGRGLGYVDAFDPNGVLLKRVAIRGVLNAPWGIAFAPAGFGQFGNRLLVGNFGDGHINAFDPNTGVYVGTLLGSDRRPLTIDGLWGLAFGNGFLGQPVDTLFFAAGPNDEEHGVYGRITANTLRGGL
jgi:uncharacterized protein (TIGR03118 family)